MTGNGQLFAAESDTLSKNQQLKRLVVILQTEGVVAARSMHVDDQGVHPGVVVTGANVHDSRLIESTKMGGWFLGAYARHLCLDKGYDYDRVGKEVHVNGFEAHIRSRREETGGQQPYPARRWGLEIRQKVIQKAQ